MNISKYMAFVAAVEYGSFTKAGDMLSYSQSAVSKMINDLEDEWKISILERSKSGVKLTSDGLKIFPYVKSVCEEYEKLQNAELIYGYGQENIIYLINASYTRASWGIDVEDEVTNSFEKEVKGCKIKIKEYQTPESNTDRYSASFKYNGLEYF